MKSMMFALAALAAFQAAAITATKEYVDRKDTEIRTNTYTKAETDARIVEISPAPDMSGVVHGDDRQADKTNFVNGLRFRASDSDGGNMRFRVQDPMDNGLTWYSDSSGTTFGNPFLRINCTGIRYPKDVEADEFGLLEWSDFTRTHTILDTMPAWGSSQQNYIYPISAGAFLNYFWNLTTLPTAAVNNFANTRTVKAASNLVDRAGALVNVEGIEERAAQLTATSTVPVYAFSDWSSDWPSDDEVQPLQPVWSNGTWSVKLKEVGGSWEYGPVSVAGAEDATNFTVNIMGYATVFNRTATETGNFNAYGLARLADVPLIVTNETEVSYTYGEWNCEWHVSANEFEYMTWSNGVWYLHYSYDYEGQHYDDDVYTANGVEDATTVRFQGVATLTREKIPVMRNALGLARRSDITNIVNKAYVEGLGIESGIQEESDPVWSSEKVNYATKQSVSVVSNLAASADTKANTLISYVNGDDVMDVVTNYDSAVHISSRSLRQRVEDGGTNVWRVVWDEMTRWDWFMYTYLPTNFYNKAEVDSALDWKADRAWGFYDSHTGGWSPDGYTQISSPKILISAGMAYQRHVVTGGAVWVLESNGLVTEVGGVASNGFFRISDDEGNALFEIVKGNKRTIGSTAGSVTTEEIMGITHMHISYAVEAAEHPTIEATTDLGTSFVSEESAGSLVNVTWTGTTGNYQAEVWPKVASSRLFVRASHEIGGETYIKNTAPTGLDGGMIYNGVKYRVVPYSSGGKTYLTLEAW